MKTSLADTAADECTQVSDRAVDAVRQAVNVAREAHLLKMIASNAVEDGVSAAKRAITHGAHNLEDLRESAAHRIKKTPLIAVGLALGAGILFGMALGRIGRKPPAQAR
jgi:ElaB/YqjD/DUF883 family membrane-anchored ribosome-binding protein